MKERMPNILVGRSNQQLFEICSGQNGNALLEQERPDKRYLQALKLLGAECPNTKTPDRNSLIAQAVRTTKEHGDNNFAELNLEEKAQFASH